MTEINGKKLLIAILSLYAVANLSAGLYDGLIIRHVNDFRTIHRYVSLWLWSGVNPYDITLVLYPPWGIVFISPISLIKCVTAAIIVWTILNAVFAAFFGTLGTNYIGEGIPKADQLVFSLCFLSWEGTKYVIADGQFGMVMVGLSLIAVNLLLKNKSDLGASVCLALSSAKITMGGAFMLWALLSQRFKPFVMASIIIAAATAVYVIKVDQNLVDVFVSYKTTIVDQFYDESHQAGTFELKPLFEYIFDGKTGAAIFITVMAGIFAYLPFLYSWRKFFSRFEFDIFLLQICCLVTLMSVYHRIYDVSLMVPVVSALMFSKYIYSANEKWHSRNQIIFWVTQVILIVDVPVVFLQYEELLTVGGFRLVNIMIHFNRLYTLLLLIFVYFQIFSLVKIRKSHARANLYA